MKKVFSVLGILSIVFAIVSIITSNIGEIVLCYTMVPIIFGAIALAFGVAGIIIAAKNQFPKKLATTGTVISIIALIDYLSMIMQVYAAIEAL